MIIKAIFFVALFVLVGLFSCTPDAVPRKENEGVILPNSLRLRLATTTSLYDTGLWDYLEPIFEDKYGIELDIVSGGTGKAIEFGKSGDVDVLSVHDKAREDEFVDQGYGIQRHEIAYNYFLIVGPEGDPASIAGMEPEEAFVELMEKGKSNSENIRFISRGDNSGTHAREKLLWEMSGRDYESVRNSGPWYLEAGAGMGAILNIADEKYGYTLTDIGTYLSLKRDLGLITMVDRGESLRNVYSIIAVNPSKHSKMNVGMSNKLIEFLTSKETKEIISSYGMREYGVPLFSVVSDLENK